MRVLVAQDDTAVAHAVVRFLRGLGHVVDPLLGGDRDESALADPRYDVVIAHQDAVSAPADVICRRVIDAGGGPRILVLARGGREGDAAANLPAGADDCLIEPFSFAELAARVDGLARRSRPAAPSLLRSHDVVLDTSRRLVTRRGRLVRLTATEMAVLEHLLGAAGQTVSADDLRERVWGSGPAPSSTALRVILSRLRRKLGEPSIILTVHGRGHRVLTGGEVAANVVAAHATTVA